MPRAAGLILVALMAALIIPTPAFAKPGERSTNSSTHLYCDQLQSEAGSAYVVVSLSDSGESYGDLGFWAAPAEPWMSPLTWAGWSNDSLLSADGAAINGMFGVYGYGDGDVDDPSDLVFIGDGTLAATLTPAGDVESWRFRDHLGNHQSRATGTNQAFTVSGTLSLPNDVSFDLSGCEAMQTSETWFSNSPAHSVEHRSDFRLSCGWDSEQGYVALFASDNDFGPTADLFVATPDGFVYAPGNVELTRTSFEGTFELIPEWDDEGNPIGTASASAGLTAADRIRHSELSPDGRITLKGTQLAVTGSLSLDINGESMTLVMDAASCQANDVRYSLLPARPEREEPVANDTPEAAIPLKLFDKLTVSTAGTDLPAEVPCTFTDPDGTTYEGSLTNTVWWRLEGTGSAITVDTAGSTFDTMVAVYLVEGDKVGPQVGCVDDVDESLQARITFETVADASYLIQTGGFGGETGDLNISIYE
jgi:hypothetical protein